MDRDEGGRDCRWVSNSGIILEVLIASVRGNLALKAIFLQSLHPFNKAHVRLQKKKEKVAQGSRGYSAPPSVQGVVLLEPVELPWCNAEMSSAPAPLLVGRERKGLQRWSIGVFSPAYLLSLP